MERNEIENSDPVAMVASSPEIMIKSQSIATITRLLMDVQTYAEEIVATAETAREKQGNRFKVFKKIQSEGAFSELAKTLTQLRNEQRRWKKENL